jgi:glyoxylase-like metal-dependent hydrolase (beta-lactamase superfamily II)
MVRTIGVSLSFLLLIGPVVSVRAQLPPIEVQKLRPNLFLVTGGNANTLVFVMSNGVAVIDTKGPGPGWGRAVASQVKELTKLPITTIINTTVSGDHVGGNPDFAHNKIDIIAHEYAAADMRKMTLMFRKPTGGGLPTRTFKDRLTLGSGPDRLELYYFGPAHTRSDIFIVIPALRVLHTGDAFGGKYLPALDRVDGGDGVEYPNTLTKALPLARNIDMIITGHGGVAKPQDLAVHRDFMRDFLESTRQAKNAGQTAAGAAKAWKLPARYVGYEAQPARVLGAMEWIYRQLP